MLNKFRNIIDADFPDEKPGMFLLAVSGGPDSMAMLDLFRRSGLTINVLHCHFGLREEADLDTQCVIDYCKKWDITVDIKYFTGVAEITGESIQMACRRLRYEWFDQQLSGFTDALIVTAHHLDDNIETLLFNLGNGGGINGLSGIPRLRGRIWRPLLSFDKQEIMAYLSDHDVGYVLDASNESRDYDRNYIRHEVIPRLEERFKNFSRKAGQSIMNLAEVKDYLDQEVGRYLSEHSRQQGDFTLLSHLEQWPIILIKQYLISIGFNQSALEDIRRALGTPGKRFLSGTHEVVTTAEGLTIGHLSLGEHDVLAIPGPGTYAIGGMDLVVSTVSPPGKVRNDPRQIVADASKVTFPLTVRTWQKGDRMRPLGMKGTKKIKDILTDEKIDQLRKRQALVLEDDTGQIIWLIGIRVSEDFKITDENNDMIRIAVENLPF